MGNVSVHVYFPSGCGLTGSVITVIKVRTRAYQLIESSTHVLAAGWAACGFVWVFSIGELDVSSFFTRSPTPISVRIQLGTMLLDSRC